ncbi:peptidase C65 Otubain-domain-containing protein [Leptodontidium sp. 2 PMI_412]|nr:peptidase C65 Otubain-domain-containing protein [Leptodontidium sp. MPI-SDFR-AT-0119]KAH9223030.1 peptidase C65 Otubain-domain-containing protein [Leptodontidium sp. 2 PMI_412]
MNDIDAQEALAREYNPALEGPLVGEKRSSLAIAEEYAKADPIYVAKTAVLPQKYSHYRPILGDGNCGWRAAGYAYFETLLRLRDKDQLEGEIARMISLNNLLITVGGFDSWMFEDMVEETTDLLKCIADLVETSPREAENLLLERFNNKEISNAIVYHFRLLASSCLKGNPPLYQDFIPDVGIDEYLKNGILIPDQEIDHLGMTLLIDVLLKPIGFAVEILYLDRSPGSQANTYLFQTEDANGIPTNPNGPMIYLLYRPSHYDILYKDHGNTIQAVKEATRNTNIQVNRATNFSQPQPIQGTPVSTRGYSQMDMSLLSYIPGFSLPPQPSHHGLPSQYSAQFDTYPLSPVSVSISPISPGASSATASNAIPASFPAQPPPPSSLTSPTLTSAHLSFPNPTTQLPIHTHLPPPLQQHRPSLSSHPSLSAHTSELSSPSPSTKSSQFRPSRYEWEAAAATDWQESPVVFQTSTFKNSHYNTAHYNNPNFQPEEWTPESEDPPVRKQSS